MAEGQRTPTQTPRRASSGVLGEVGWEEQAPGVPILRGSPLRRARSVPLEAV
jgi:hypothetical protein